MKSGGRCQHISPHLWLTLILALLRQFLTFKRHKHLRSAAKDLISNIIISKKELNEFIKNGHNKTVKPIFPNS